jgi:hypothetical protein
MSVKADAFSFLSWSGYAFVILVVVFGGAVLGMLAARLLPEQHLSSETRTVVSASMAIVGTLSALVLGLLISTASTSFATRDKEVTNISANLIRIHFLLERYGPETQESRAILGRYTAAMLRDLFPDNSDRPADLQNEATAAMLWELESRILALTPSNDAQRWLQSRELELASAVGDTRWLLAQQSAATIPFPILVLLVFWLAIVFASFGLFAPRNLTVGAALFLCAIAVSCAVQVIFELDTPFQGIIRISSAPTRHALEMISR